MGVQVHELDLDFFEGSLSKEMSFDSGEGLVGVVVGLLDEGEFLSLGLVESSGDGIGFFQSF